MYFSEVFLINMLQLLSSSIVATLHILHHQSVLRNLMWTLIYSQWVTFLHKWLNYSNTLSKKIWNFFSYYFTFSSC